MAWWSKLRDRLKGKGDDDAPARGRGDAPPITRRAPGPAVWREVGETTFDVRVLDLIAVTGQLIAASSDPACAARAASWSTSVGDELDGTALDRRPGTPCELRYPAATLLPDGLLFTPRGMDDKWVLALRGDRILAARSWTGEVVAAARIRRAPGEVTLERIGFHTDAELEHLGDPVRIVDWLVRTLALGQLLPLPVHADGARLLERTPTLAFSLFGHAAVCAATSWTPGPAPRPLRADGRVLLATRADDHVALRRLAAAGEPLDAPSPDAGLTALCVPAVRGDLALTNLLLELGADPNARDDRGMSPLGHAIVHGAGLPVLTALADAGADLSAVNVDGFGLLHAAAECGRGELVPWLLGRGVALEARTGRGHTALQLACALGTLDAVDALLAAGADPQATSPDGTAREIAVREQQSAVVARLAL